MNALTAFDITGYRRPPNCKCNMALVKLIKIHASLQPTPSILLEHRNVKEYLLVEASSAIELSKSLKT